MRAEYDVVVLGGGAAGLVAAIVAASLGAKTALVERDRLGGDCTWRGCVPSKALLRVAAVAHGMRTAANFGIASHPPDVEWSRVRARLDDVRQAIYEEADAPPALERYGVRVVAGEAVFLDARRLRVSGPHADETLTARRFVVATGSDPAPLALGVPYLTSDDVFDLDRQPRRLAIVGGGPVAAELAQAFARLGTDVQVVTRGARLLPRDDAEHALALQDALASEGVRFTFGAEPVTARAAGGETVLVLSTGTELRCDTVLAALGRVPRVTGFGLDAAGIAVAGGAIAVDAFCRTGISHIYAVGDVTGPPYFTHAGEEMSKVAIANALLRLPRRYDRARVPWCTYTSPELAHAGASEAELRERGVRYETLAFPEARVDRAIVDGAVAGGTKLFVDRHGRLLGASVLSARAGETIGELALAMRLRAPVTRIADTVHPYPTYAYGARRAADTWYLRRLTPFALGALRRVLRLRGRAPSGANGSTP